jgi:hypothetical protein
MDWADRFAATAQSNANAAGSFLERIMKYSLQPSIWGRRSQNLNCYTTAILYPLGRRFKAKIDAGLKMMKSSTEQVSVGFFGSS